MLKLPHTLLAAMLTGLQPLTVMAENEPGFRYGGESFFGSELPGQVRQKLFEIGEKANEQRKQVFDQVVIQRYLQERSKAEGKSVEELQQEILAVPPPDEVTVRKFYDENKELIGQPFEKIKQQIARYIRQQRAQERFKVLIERIEKEKGYTAVLPKLDPPVFDIAVKGYPY